MTSETVAEQEGRAAGLRREGSAADCPYLPGGDQVAERTAWLKGFSAVRARSSPASDPARAARVGEPQKTGKASAPGYKSG